MLRSFVLSLLTLMLAASPGLGEEGSYKGVFFSTPSGWSSGEQEGRFLLAPDDITEQTAVVVVLYGAEKLGGKSFNDWFRDRMSSDLHPQAKVLSDGEIKSTNVGGLQMLTTARAVQDAEGGVRIQMYHAVSDGRQAALAMGVTASEEAINKYSGGIQALFESLRFSRAVEPGANPSPGPAAQPSVTPPAGKGEPLPKAEVVNGKPQGLFAGVSMLSGNPVFLLFLPGGRVYHNMPHGGMSRIEWAALEADNQKNCGRWSMTGNKLRIDWNDGNFWEGPLELTQTGIKFYNKRYGRVVPVAQREMVGSWEGARSTAWMSPGSGTATTLVNNITVDGSGNFVFASAMGSNVESATAYGESSQRGRLTIEGYDAVFQKADGTTMRMSIARFANGDDLILLDGTAYHRR